MTKLISRDRLPSSGSVLSRAGCGSGASCGISCNVRLGLHSLRRPTRVAWSDIQHHCRRLTVWRPDLRPVVDGHDSRGNRSFVGQMVLIKVRG